MVDHDAALYLYRAYVVMGREVKLYHRGKTETCQTHDDAFYHPDIFAVGSPFQLPDGTPPCVQRLIHTYNGGCGVPVTGGRDTTAPVAFFGTRPADGSIASFVAKGQGKPDEDPYGAGDARAEHVGLGGWRVHGYTWHWRNCFTVMYPVSKNHPRLWTAYYKLPPEWGSWRLSGSCFGGGLCRRRVFGTLSKRLRTGTGRFLIIRRSNVCS